MTRPEQITRYRELPAPARCIACLLPADHGNFLPTVVIHRIDSRISTALEIVVQKGDFCRRCVGDDRPGPGRRARRLRKIILVVVPILIGAGLLAALERSSSANAPASAPSAPTYASSTLLWQRRLLRRRFAPTLSRPNRCRPPRPAPRGKRPVRRRHRSPADRVAWHEVRRHRVRPRQVRRREVRRGQVRGRCVRRCSARRHRILACGRGIDFGRTTHPPRRPAGPPAPKRCAMSRTDQLHNWFLNLEKCAAYRELADGLLDGIRSRTRLSVKSP